MTDKEYIRKLEKEIVYLKGKIEVLESTNKSNSTHSSRREEPVENLFTLVGGLGGRR